MNEKDLDKFDPTVADLTAMVAATKNITATDLADAKQLAVVKENRITLKKARVQIEKTGKALREEAVAFQRAVIAKEKELIGIIAPEEDRLAEIEEQAKVLALKRERLAQLPRRKERLSTAGIDVKVPEEILLSLNDTEFDAFINTAVAAKNEADRVENERKQREEEAIRRAEAERVQKEQDARQAELDAKARQLEQEKREIEHQKEVAAAKKETEERMRREAEEKAAQETAEAERLEKQKLAEKKALEKKAAYVAFLKQHGYTKETSGEFHTIETDTGYELYKKVGFFPKI